MRPELRPAAGGSDDRLSEVLAQQGAPSDIRERLSDLLAAPGAGLQGGVSGPVLAGPPEVELAPIEPALLVTLAEAIPSRVSGVVQPGALQQVADILLETLRHRSPQALPGKPLAEGVTGARLPLPDRIAGPLLRQAAADVAEAGERVIWDDGINQLVVEIGGISLETGTRRVTVAIPVQCDQVRTTMKVPFATGGDGRVAGLVTAAPDRPVGDELIAQVWGGALIALAHASLMSMAEALAAASGRDERNDTLVPRALHAEPGLLRLETEARKRLGGIAR